MKRSIIHFVSLVTILLFPVVGLGEEGWTPIQLKLNRDVAIFSNDKSVYGVRLGFWEPPWESDLDRGSHIVGMDLSLAASSPRQVWGIQASLLSAYSDKMTGIAVGGVVAYTSEMTGITVGGLLADGGGLMKGIAVGGVVAYTSEMTGLTAGGLVAFSDDTTGIAVAGLWTNGERMTGLAVGGVFTTCRDITGLQFAGFLNRAENVRGVQIGIVTYCKKLNGIQLGLLNRVNGKISLPVINARF